jgi:hypothetical protein
VCKRESRPTARLLRGARREPARQSSWQMAGTHMELAAMQKAPCAQVSRMQ